MYSVQCTVYTVLIEVSGWCSYIRLKADTTQNIERILMGAVFAF